MVKEDQKGYSVWALAAGIATAFVVGGVGGSVGHHYYTSRKKDGEQQG